MSRRPVRLDAKTAGVILQYLKVSSDDLERVWKTAQIRPTETLPFDERDAWLLEVIATMILAGDIRAELTPRTAPAAESLKAAIEKPRRSASLESRARARTASQAPGNATVTAALLGP